MYESFQHLYSSMTASCPIFAHPLSYDTFAIGYSSGDAYILDAKTLFPRTHISGDSVSIVPTTEVPLYYAIEDNMIRAMAGSYIGVTPILEYETPEALSCINTLYIDSTLFVFLSVKEERDYYVCIRALLVVNHKLRVHSVRIRLSAVLTSASTDGRNFIVTDAAGLLVIGRCSQILDYVRQGPDARDELLGLDCFTTGRLWPRERERRVDGLLRRPVSSVICADFGVCAVASAAGTIHLFDLSLTPIEVNGGRLGLDLRGMLALTPTVFTMLFAGTLLIVVLERAPMLVVALPSWISASAIFLSRFYSQDPYSVRNFLINDPSTIWAVLQQLNVSANFSLRGGRGRAQEAADIPVDALDAIFKDVYGAECTLSAECLRPDCEGLRLEVITLILGRELWTAKDEFHVAMFANAASYVINQAILANKVELAYGLVVRLRQKRPPLCRLRTVFAECVGRGYSLMASICSETLGSNVNCVRIAEIDAENARLHTDVHSLERLERSDFAVAVDNLLQGRFALASRALSALGVDRLIDGRMSEHALFDTENDNVLGYE